MRYMARSKCSLLYKKVAITQKQLLLQKNYTLLTDLKVLYSVSYSEDPMSLSSDIAEICVPYIFKILWLYVKLRDESGKARL